MTLGDFTPLPALLGGALIGTAVSLFLFTTGKVAGISGILGGLVQPQRGDLAWRVAFVVGLLVAGLGAALLAPSAVALTVERSAGAMALAGLLVGFGTRLGNGCTSGHGVCGLSRGSPRSLVSTLTFIASGAVIATLVRTVAGGSL